MSDILSPDFARGVFMSDRVSMNSQRSSYHGGAFFDAIGREFDSLERINDVISADVLDAWFPPSPAVIDVLQEHLSWAVGTSPPTESEGLTSRIARTRGGGAGVGHCGGRILQPHLPGPSTLADTGVTGAGSRPVLRRVRSRARKRRQVQCGPPGLESGGWLRGRSGPARTDGCADGTTLIVIVNPNNPTGRHIPQAGTGRGDTPRIA